jgi:hypothetical protein
MLAVVYEDTDTHREATAVYELLLQELGDNVRINASWWRTSLLGDPKLSKVAARAIGAADLILVSVHNATGPSPLVREWIESWPIDVNHPPRMIGLLHGRTEEAYGSWDHYLQETARHWGMPYVSGSLAAITEPWSEPAHGRAIIDDAIGEPYVHWGLNE